MRYFLALLLLLVLCSQSVAQMWSVEVFDGNAMGMGTVISVDDKDIEEGWRYALVATADHVVDSSTGIKIKFENGRSSSNCTVLGRNKRADIALIWCKVPSDIVPLEVGEESIIEGDMINFVGRFRRKFSGRASPLVFPDVAWSDVVVIPGDSGGSVILNGKLVGVISGGMQWAPNPPQRTWPCRSSNLAALIELVKAANKTGKWRGVVQPVQAPPAQS